MNWWHWFWPHKTKSTVLRQGSWWNGVTIYSYQCLTCNKEWKLEVW